MTLVAASANDRYGVKGWQDIKTTTKMTLVAAPANDRYGVKGWQDIKTTKNDTCGSFCQW